MRTTTRVGEHMIRLPLRPDGSAADMTLAAGALKDVGPLARGEPSSAGCPGSGDVGSSALGGVRRNGELTRLPRRGVLVHPWRTFPCRTVDRSSFILRQERVGVISTSGRHIASRPYNRDSPQILESRWGCHPLGADATMPSDPSRHYGLHADRLNRFDRAHGSRVE